MIKICQMHATFTFKPFPGAVVACPPLRFMALTTRSILRLNWATSKEPSSLQILVMRRCAFFDAKEFTFRMNLDSVPNGSWVGAVDEFVVHDTPYNLYSALSTVLNAEAIVTGVNSMDGPAGFYGLTLLDGDCPTTERSYNFINIINTQSL